MLPRKTRDDVMELDSSDLIEDPSRPSLEVRPPPPPREPPTTRFRPPTPVRPSVPDEIEDDVAGECLASIAAESSKIPPLSITASTVPSRPSAPLRDAPSSSRLERATLPPPSSALRAVGPPAAVPQASRSAMASAPRLPAVSAPPFVRTSSGSIAAAPSSSRPVERDSKPSIFTRTSASPAPGDTTPVTSVAPVAMSTPPRAAENATVILLRERPKTAWIAASAAVGALCALVVTRMFSSAPEAPAAPPVAAVTAPPPAPAPSQAAAVITFDDDDALSIPAPSATANKAPIHVAPPVVTAKPIATVKPAIAPTPKASAAPSALAAKSPEPPPAPPPKRPLTPEQQLAEAQLKASMR